MAESKKDKETAVKPKVVPKKRPRKKPAIKASTEKEGVEAGEESQGEQKKSTPARKPSGRRPARKTKETSLKSTPSKIAADEQIEVEVVPEIDATVPRVEEPVSEEKVAPKRPRGRRGRGPGKKPAVVEETSLVAEKAEEVVEPEDHGVLD